MSRISIQSVEQALEASNPPLTAIKQQLGVVPNVMRLRTTMDSIS